MNFVRAWLLIQGRLSPLSPSFLPPLKKRMEEEMDE